MDYKKVLEGFGATEIESYNLVNNYGYRFTINGNRYDIRFWANCYGVEVNKWFIHPCTQLEDGKYAYMDKELKEKIEKAFNE